MIRKFKMWLYNKYLPRVTKEKYIEDMNKLLQCNHDLKQENRELKAYIEGVQDTLRSRARVEIKNEVNK